jgi:hypothetical protein
MTLYVVKIEENKLLTHDGETQLGIFNMSLQQFHDLTKEQYTETYWSPDTFSQRYKRLNYQKHLREASIGTKDEIGR